MSANEPDLAVLPDARQERFLTALLETGTLRAAATAAGISYITARRWFASPPIRDAYDDARRDVLRAALNKLADTASEAVDTLRACMTEDKPANVRVRAASAVLEALLRAKDVLDLDARLAALEARNAGPTNR